MKKIIGFLLVAVFFSTVGIFSASASTVVDGIKVTKKTAKKVYLTWDNVENAEKYQIRVIRKKNKKLVKKRRSLDNKAVVRGLKPYKKYKIKIKAKVDGAYQKSSDAEIIRTNKGKIYLTGEDNKTTVNWESKIDADNGYKLVWSKESNPEYPTRSSDKYQYYSDSETEKGSIYAFNGDGYYYVRVCEYVGGACGVYSNQIRISLTDSSTGDEEDEEEDEENAVESITLSAQEEDCNSSSIHIFSNNTCYNVKWEVEGESSNGFKLVWSKNSEPEYPTRDEDTYAYYSSSQQEEGAVTATYGSGTYYVRVCEYLGGFCGVYSNQIMMDFLVN